MGLRFLLAEAAGFFLATAVFVPAFLAGAFFAEVGFDVALFDASL
jgi:hypothetical protein